MDDIERRGRARRRGGLVIRGAAGVAALALAAGGRGPRRPRRPGHPRTSTARTSTATGTPRVQTAAYVVAHTESALAQIGRYIIKDQVRSSSGDDTLWTDPRTGQHLPAGRAAAPAGAAAWGSHLPGRARHALAHRPGQLRPPDLVDPGHPRRGPDPGRAARPSTAAPPAPRAQIRASLSAGHYQIIGHRVINGHRAIGLKGPWARGYLEIWVDAGSYQPVRVVIADFADQPGPLRHDHIAASESWVARSPALVQLVNHPRIPAGFTHVPAP